MLDSMGSHVDFSPIISYDSGFRTIQLKKFLVLLSICNITSSHTCMTQIKNNFSNTWSSIISQTPNNRKCAWPPPPMLSISRDREIIQLGNLEILMPAFCFMRLTLIPLHQLCCLSISIIHAMISLYTHFKLITRNSQQ
jgi:hypothetical protein